MEGQKQRLAARAMVKAKGKPSLAQILEVRRAPEAGMLMLWTFSLLKTNSAVTFDIASQY